MGTMLHVSTIINYGCHIVFPILALGFMSALSGGGNTPEFQLIGMLMAYLAPVTLVSVFITELFWRNAHSTIAYPVLIAPVIIWIVLIIWLQMTSQFFFK
jgi:hypothetical protein